MNISEFIEKIGYNQEWLDFGFLSQDFIARQLSDYIKSNDMDIAHYKWAAYKEVLANEEFTDLNRLKQFMKLINNDPDEHLYKGAVSELIFRKLLTEDILLEVGPVRFANDKKIMDKLSLPNNA
jgi:hypothetical protein